MTVSYSRLVANGSSFGCFWSILCKWRGSVYKLIWRELLVYLVIYFCINFTYRYALDDRQQRTFEQIREYFNKHSENIPMAFVLGFYVSLVVKRWWEQYRLLPWPDTLALFVSAAIPGCEEKGRLMRRNIVRYAILAYVITLKHVSVRVKKRFPTLQHIVDAGIMLESEKKIVEMMDQRATMAKYWMPLVWATNIINRARKEGLIRSDHLVQTLLVELSEHRRKLGSIISYDTVCLPLVYTQVVTLSVYIYFLSALMGRQFIIHPTPNGKQEADVYFPIFTVLQFCFYIGWLKVAEVLIGPFGEDDDDIELNWLIDRHIKAAYMIVDEMHEEHPELLKDQYWDEVVPRELPYTVASEHYRRQEPKGSAEFYKVKQSESIYANLTHRKSIAPHPEDVYADYESVDTPLVERRKNWLQRQIQRMGSTRSSSTYSSGLFGRTRHNSSVYSNPDHHGQPGLPPVGGEGGIPGHLPHGVPQIPLQHPHKMSIYDRFIGRKSTRRGKGPGKLNMANIPANLKNRPRIPTPDVTKEDSEKENRILSFQNNNSINSNNNHNQTNAVTSSSTIVSNNPLIHTAIANSNSTLADLPLVQVVLTPIQENGDNQSSITSNSTAASLAQMLNPDGSATLAHVVTPDGSPTGTLAKVLTPQGSPTTTLAHVLTPQGSPTGALAKMFQSSDGSPTVTIAQVLAPASHSITAQAGTAGTAALAQAILSPTFSSAGMLTPVTVAVTPLSPLARRNPSQPRITEVVDTSVGSDSACGSSTSSTSSTTSMDDRSRKASVTSQSRRSEVYV